jgi:3-mercaptopyruvate sulfurtransferase SseA
MSFSPEDIRANHEYSAHKLRAEKQRNDVLKAVEASQFDFVLTDTRGREPFAQGHIPGAWCLPATHVAEIVPRGCPATKSL